MSFDALIEKVKQAEGALEAHERQGAAGWRQFKSSWRASWTPGRIVGAGLLSGFLVGRAQPLRHVDGASTLRLFSALSGLLAVSRADDAADAAHQAAESAEDATGEDTPPSSAQPLRADPARVSTAKHDPD